MFKIPEKCFECGSKLTSYKYNKKNVYQCEYVETDDRHITVFDPNVDWTEDFGSTYWSVRIFTNKGIYYFCKTETRLIIGNEPTLILRHIPMDFSNKQEIENKINMLLTFR